MRLSILISVLMLLLIHTPCLDSNFLKYPGNGFPHLSKDKPIAALNGEILEKAKAYSGVSFANGVMKFKVVKGYMLNSSKRFNGDSFCISLPINIEKGECIIKVGNLTFMVTDKTYIVFNGKSKILDRTNVNIKEIIIERFSVSNSSIRYEAGGTLPEILNVKINTPADISIQIKDNSVGFIGPWTWERGYE